MATNKDSFCVFRWDQSVINFSTSGLTTCCRTMPKAVTKEEIQKHGKDVFLNSDYLVERRKEMLEGVRHGDCRECWDIEEQGHTSFRKTQHNWNEPWESYLKRVGGSNNPAVSTHAESLILFIGNTCDLKCIYCSNYLSTSWAAEDLKYGKITKQYYDELTTPVEGLDDVFWEFFEEHKLKVRHLSFVGGEPLTMKRTYDFLEKIGLMYKDVDLPHFLTIDITTNLNAGEKSFSNFLAALEKLNKSFFRIKIDGSIDTVGDRAAYIRNGISWDRWKSNFTRLLEIKHLNIVHTVIPSISALSVTTFRELFDELGRFQEKYGKKILVQENIIMTPQFLSPYVLPPEYAHYIEEAAASARKANLQTEGNEEYGKFLDKIASTVRKGDPNIAHSKYRRELHSYLKNLNQRRNNDHRKTFPEMEPFFRLCEAEDKYYRRGMVGRTTPLQDSAWIRKESTVRETNPELKIPLDNSVDPDAAFWEWFRFNESGFHEISFFKGDPSADRDFQKFIAGMDSIFQERGRRVHYLVNSDLAGPYFRQFIEGMTKVRSPFSLTVGILNAGDRGPFLASGVSLDLWLERFEELITSISLSGLDVLLPVHLFTVPDLPKIIEGLVRVRKATGKRFTIKQHQGLVPEYLAPVILTKNEAPAVFSALQLLNDHFPESTEIIGFVSHLGNYLANKGTDDEERWKRSQFLQFIDGREVTKRLSFTGLYLELRDFVNECRHQEATTGTELTEASLRETLKKIFPQHRRFLDEKPDVIDARLLSERCRTMDYHDYLSQSFDFLARIHFLAPDRHKDIIEAHKNVVLTDIDPSVAPFKGWLYHLMEQLSEDRRKLFLNLYPDVRRLYRLAAIEKMMGLR